MDSDEDVDIESDFHIKREQFTAENIVKNKTADSGNKSNWADQTTGLLDDDVDPESRQAILKILESDQHSAAVDYGAEPNLVLSSYKTSAAMKATSRHLAVLWTDEDKALFDTGVEIYGKSWKDIAELLPHKTISEVEAYGRHYFKMMNRSIPKQKKKKVASSIQRSKPTPNIHQQQSAVISSMVVQVIEEDEGDEDVDIMNDTSNSSSVSDSESEPVSGIIGTRPRSTHHYPDSIQSNSVGSNGVPRVSDDTLTARGFLSKSDAGRSPLSVQHFVMPSLLNNTLPYEVNETSLPSQSLSVVMNEDIFRDQVLIPETSLSPVRSHQINARLQQTQHSGNSRAQRVIKLEKSENLQYIKNSVQLEHSGHQLTFPEQFDNCKPCNVASSQPGEKSQTIHRHFTHDSISSPNPPTSSPETLTQVSGPGSPSPVKSVDIELELREETLDNIVSFSGAAASSPTNAVEELESYYTVSKSAVEFGVLDSNGELVKMPAPVSEVEIHGDAISEQERRVHFEFFENRVNKTPERYLRIRNYITNQWHAIKPRYLNKTSVRSGLKQCGDVNCIGRIHSYLEQLGAINFGCEQAVYQRMAMSTRAPMATGKQSAPSDHLLLQISNKTRKRKPPPSKGAYLEGTTLEHGVDAEPTTAPPRSKNSKLDSSRQSTFLDSFTLISCADFVTSGLTCPYQVILESPAAVVMDIHAHLCKTEVIGLLGGEYSEKEGTLRVVRAEPCSSKSSSLHCDMDAVSQTEAGQRIQQSGLQVVGWYHSHPTFVPDPSQQDIESQEAFQTWFAKEGGHFLGVIVSPYNPTNETANSKIRCFTNVKDLDGFKKKSSKPYKFDYKVETTTNIGELSSLISKVSRLLEMHKHYQHNVDLLDTYTSTSELTSLDKMLLSVETHLRTADPHLVDTSLLLQDLRFLLTGFCEKSDL